MPKQGVHSVGGATLVHRRLFPTEAWTGDEDYAERRQRHGVPKEAAAFRTKPQLALEMLTEMVAEGSLPARWVSCDEGYGRSVDFLDGVAALGLGCMAEVPVDTRIWPGRRRPAGGAPGSPAGPRRRNAAAARAHARRRLVEQPP